MEEIVTRFREYGYDGIELRGVGPDLLHEKAPYFSTSKEIAATKRMIADAGLAAVCIDTSATFSNQANAPQSFAHARASIDLAAALGAYCIRVFGGDVPEFETRESAVARVADAMNELSATERAAFVLRHFEGMCMEDVSRVLECQPGAAKHSVFRAVQKLRRALEPLVSTAR